MLLAITDDDLVAEDTLCVEDCSLVREHGDSGADACGQFLSSITVDNLVVLKNWVLFFTVLGLLLHDWRRPLQDLLDDTQDEDDEVSPAEHHESI